jgi:hypothetical protein
VVFEEGDFVVDGGFLDFFLFLLGGGRGLVSVCERGGKKERERGREKVCVCVRVYVCMCVSEYIVGNMAATVTVVITVTAWS